MGISKKDKWENMQYLGKMNYILKYGILYYGLMLGVSISILTLIIDFVRGDKFIDFADSIFIEFLYRAFFLTTFWSIIGVIKELTIWKEYEKKYSNDDNL